MTSRESSAGESFAIGLVASIAAVLIFAWLAEHVARGVTIAFDAAVRDFVHRHSGPPLTEFMRLVSALGSGMVLPLLILITFALLFAVHTQRAAFFFLITMTGAVVIDSMLKIAFHRARPVPFFGTPEPRSYSFPSGHALVLACYFGIVAAFATARIRSRAARAVIWTAAVVMALLVGYSRIYLGVHYPSDVVGGLAAAVVWVSAAAHADRLW